MTNSFRPKLIAGGLVLLGIVVIFIFRFSHGTPQPAPAAPENAAVVVAPSRSGKMENVLSVAGSVASLNSVIVRPRIDGQIKHIQFQEGTYVKQGDPLVQIDDASFVLELRQAQSQYAKDRSLLDYARQDLARSQALGDKGMVSSQQLELKASQVAQYEAALAVDAALVDRAQLVIGYTKVGAPISGRLGFQMVGPGSFVRANDSVGIVAVTQMQPIGVVFLVPEKLLPAIRRQLKIGAQVSIETVDSGHQRMSATSESITVDNQIDAATGTVKLRVLFPNEDRQLVPNQFVNVRLIVNADEQAILVPRQAVQQGVAGPFVYLYKDGIVRLRQVVPGGTENEETAIVQGIAAGELVVIDGVDRVRDKMRIAATVRQAGPAAGPHAVAVSLR